MEKKWIQINPIDNVAVALSPLQKGETIELGEKSVILKEDIAQGHKFALKPIKAQENIMKYGLSIGHAKQDIQEGEWVHIHNIKTNLNDVLEYTYDKNVQPLEPQKERIFLGYRRPNGKVGIRNEIWIIPTVGCVNNIAQAIERATQSLVQEGVEAICAFPHRMDAPKWEAIKKTQDAS